MAKCPLVRPETVRVSLPDGESWVELAKELTSGENREVWAAQFKDAPMGTTVPMVDLRLLGQSRILGYVKEWSFVDFKGEPLPISAEWLQKFDQETYTDVATAVETHHEACEQAIEARKNDRAGTKKS